MWGLFGGSPMVTTGSIVLVSDETFEGYFCAFPKIINLSFNIALDFCYGFFGVLLRNLWSLPSTIPSVRGALNGDLVPEDEILESLFMET